MGFPCLKGQVVPELHAELCGGKKETGVLSFFSRVGIWTPEDQDAGHHGGPQAVAAQCLGHRASSPHPGCCDPLTLTWEAT